MEWNAFLGGFAPTKCTGTLMSYLLTFRIYHEIEFFLFPWLSAIKSNVLNGRMKRTHFSVI